ncbi:putative reverse transcriptase domain-containing protein [Tanacetum coccineum]
MPPRKAPRTRTTPATATATTPMTDVAIRALISRGVADALAEHEIQRNNNYNGDGSQGSGSGITRPVRPTRECTYTDFLKCQPMNFKGTEGVVGLTQWFERMETVFNISNCAVENQVKFVTCTLHGVALTWSSGNANTGTFKRECPKLKNNNHGNQGRNGNAPAKVYVVGNAGTNSDSNIVMGTFLLNNHYAYILFDTGAERSFVSTAFSSQIDITPTTLDYYYDVELVGGKIIGINTIIRGCTLNFLSHPFNIDLMPVELGSFDVIIGMDWLAKYHAVIVCAKKIVCIP